MMITTYKYKATYITTITTTIVYLNINGVTEKNETDLLWFETTTYSFL